MNNFLPTHKNGETIHTLIEATFNAQADQCCIVRRPAGVSPAGIMVLLVGEAAVLKIGGGVLTFVKAQQLGDPAKMVELDFHQSTDRIFNWLERLNRSGSERRWAYGIFFLSPTSNAQLSTFNPQPIRPTLPVAGAVRPQRERIRCACCVVSGTDLCIPLAAELTARGLACSLT